MNNSFVNVVQKCICIDFLLNALINFNPYEYLKSLISMKDENLKNIKVICQMYESIYKDKLVLEDVPNIKLNKNYENCLNTLLEYNLSLITELEFLKHNPSNHNHYKFLQNLISSYFNSISLINCLYATRLPNTSLFIDNNNIFFNLINSIETKQHDTHLSLDLIRKISIEAVNLFFSYSLIDKIIEDEYYEVFFKNSPENKFYQYYFKSLGNIFKIRILDSNSNVFYLHRSSDKSEDIVSSLNKDDAQFLVDTYLKNKFKSNYYLLHFDESYINVSYYEKLIESYKFKYNYGTNNDKVNISKTLYVTIDATSSSVQEITYY